MHHHWAYRVLLGLILAPFRALGWALKEMARQLVGKAKSTFAPLLWPIALLGFLAIVYAIGGEQALNVVFLYVVAFALLLVGLRMIFSPRDGGKKKKKP